jgi:hypothetical protein
MCCLLSNFIRYWDIFYNLSLATGSHRHKADLVEEPSLRYRALRRKVLAVRNNHEVQQKSWANLWPYYLH